MLSDSFKEINVFISFYVLFKSLRLSWKYFIKWDLLLSLSKVENKCLYCFCIVWASSFIVRSFNLMYLVNKLVLIEIDCCKPMAFHALFLNFSFCLESFVRDASISKIGLNLVRKFTLKFRLIHIFIYKIQLNSPNLQIGCQE